MAKLHHGNIADWLSTRQSGCDVDVTCLSRGVTGLSFTILVRDCYALERNNSSWIMEVLIYRHFDGLRARLWIGTVLYISGAAGNMGILYIIRVQCFKIVSHFDESAYLVLLRLCVINDHVFIYNLYDLAIPWHFFSLRPRSRSFDFKFNSQLIQWHEESLAEVGCVRQNAGNINMIYSPLMI